MVGEKCYRALAGDVTLWMPTMPATQASRPMDCRGNDPSSSALRLLPVMTFRAINDLFRDISHNIAELRRQVAYHRGRYAAARNTAGAPVAASDIPMAPSSAYRRLAAIDAYLA